MTVTTQRTADPSTTSATVVEAPTVVESRRSGRRMAALVAGLVVVTAATVGTWAVLSRPTPATDTSWTSAYGPGSTTFSGQVPVAPWTAAYGPGSTTYREQVPSVPGSGWTSAYGPGSATYGEQVPQG